MDRHFTTPARTAANDTGASEEPFKCGCGRTFDFAKHEDAKHDPRNEDSVFYGLRLSHCPQCGSTRSRPIPGLVEEEPDDFARYAVHYSSSRIVDDEPVRCGRRVRMPEVST